MRNLKLPGAMYPTVPGMLVLVGVAAFCWAIWISRNDIVFHKSHYLSILQVMFVRYFG
jgi:hypothetical protein